MIARRRAARSYARRGPVRQPYDRALIVCEGKKTEPYYFTGLRLHYRLSSANIQIMPANGTDPLSIVSFAEDRLGDYDRAFCVFDRDGHQNYDTAVAKVAQSMEGRTGKLVAITSWPCFEFWILLHFSYSAAPFNRAGEKSSFERVISKSVSRRRAIDDRQLRPDHRGVERRSIVEIEQILEGARILIAQRQVKTPGAPARLIV